MSGKVSLNGEPVTGGILTFYTADAGSYSASIDAEGNYRAVDLPTGEMTVTVDNHYLDPNAKTPAYAGQGGGPVGGAKAAGGPMAAMYGKTMSGPSGAASGYKGKGVELGPTPEGAQTVKEGAFVKIPSIYTKKETSTAKISLGPGDNQKDIELTGK